MAKRVFAFYKFTCDHGYFFPTNFVRKNHPLVFPSIKERQGGLGKQWQRLFASALVPEFSIEAVLTLVKHSARAHVLLRGFGVARPVKFSGKRRRFFAEEHGVKDGRDLSR